ncbi:hypothetical protein ACWEF9_39420 [Streptomyces sp. NPDC004980]
MNAMLSLRTRVAVAAATGTTLVVGVLAVFLFVAIERNNIRHVDEQLDLMTEDHEVSPVSGR